jgi:hypothetical protein
LINKVAHSSAMANPWFPSAKRRRDRSDLRMDRLAAEVHVLGQRGPLMAKLVGHRPGVRPASSRIVVVVFRNTCVVIQENSTTPRALRNALRALLGSRKPAPLLCGKTGESGDLPSTALARSMSKTPARATEAHADRLVTS